MGYVRFLLAAIVVGYHLHIYLIHETIGGLAAVEAFFIISGFYMAAAYEKHYAGRPIAFLTSRFLRLYPFYIFTVAATALLYAFNGSNESEILTFFTSKSAPVFSNFSMIGLDFAAINDSLDLIARQAWSISAEMAFYALLPVLILLSRKWLIALAVAAFVVKLSILHWVGWEWAYYPFSSQIGYFLIGILVYFERDRLTWSKNVGYALLALYILYALGDHMADVDYHAGIAQAISLILVTSLVIPTLFRHISSRSSALLGDLSYGVYISHFLIVQIGIDFGLLQLETVDKLRVGCQAAAVISVAAMLAFAFERLVQQPMDNWRRRAFYSKSRSYDSHDVVAGDRGLHDGVRATTSIS